jgi:ribosomal protein S18 acetylase RimI-like enzyme
MSLTVVPALDFSLAELAELLNSSFRGYLVEIKFNPSLVNYLLRQDHVDLTASQVVLEAGQPVGLALVARRGWSSRVAAMGINSERRGQGVGEWLMKRIIAQARERQERTLLLEVIEQNHPAVRLYQKLGFQMQRRLAGYRGQLAEGQAHEGLQEVDIREVAHLLTCYSGPDLPWQLSGETLAQSGWPNRGYRLGAAYGAISNPEQPQITLKALVVPPAARRQGAATALLQALAAEYPGKTWAAPPIWPEEVTAGLFEKLGFTRESLSQLQMILTLR